MKRFWLLLLAFVLPLQMSWAATHFCDDAASLGGSVAHAAQAAHQPDNAEPSGKKYETKKPMTECCGAAHGCHGLHHVMGHPEALLPSLKSAGPVAPADGPAACTFDAVRVERPKWLAA